jgi:hypothetical protein
MYLDVAHHRLRHGHGSELVLGDYCLVAWLYHERDGVAECWRLSPMSVGGAQA